ncbi:phosphatidylserine decarboxylase family protein [Geobacter pelophilus]|uniref:Phosphatidylserine decarboxylase proenzyme n=1 Tax=Geoanaerobacter pelophilus TaxID=60036 RepID=A0AAW4L3P6_9BACT|nr:phosphatidylserine decarboxylase family protein [Geoanaerobacter pelophilus]MBT0663235.1 phosphatidylserine decarboxylase family protein [Geoanaerobacter pelophilus]
MDRPGNFPVAPEGFPFIIAGGIVTAVLAWLCWSLPAAFMLVVTLFIVFFFRNPVRNAPSGEDKLVAPADGVVIYLGDAVEPHLGQEMTKISIFMSVFNVHVNRAPVTGTVLDSFYISGKFLDVRHERATFENEQSGLVIATNGGKKIVVVQVAGLIARRIVCYAGKGDLLERGKRYGLIRFGSRLDVYLPKETEIMVKMGQKTVAGETVLGILG